MYFFFRPLGVCALVWALVMSTANGEIYKWQDSQGRIHYSDTPPKDKHVYREVSQELPHVHRLEPIRKGSLTSTYSQLDSKAKASTRASSTSSSYYYDLQSHAPDRTQSRCDRYRAELERVQKQLRAGYKGNSGNQLRERRRDLSEKLYRECRDG